MEKKGKDQYLGMYHLYYIIAHEIKQRIMLHWSYLKIKK